MLNLDNIVLTTENLTKKFKKKTVVDNLNISIQQGDIFGFLGPNGAGKTTTIRMLVGLIKPTSGKITIFGKDLQQDFTEVIKDIGAIVENPELYPFYTGRQNLIHFAKLSGEVDKNRIEEVIRLVRLENRIDTKVKTYSLGMRQRLGLAQALLNRPKLLILDEPTNGLDPQGMKEVREIISHLAREEKITIFISSHLLHEIEQLCNKVAIISNGKLVVQGKVEELLSKDQQRANIEVDNVSKAMEILNTLPFVQEVKSVDNKIKVKFVGDSLGKINKHLVLGDIEVKSLVKENGQLEEFFLNLTGGDQIA
ncbi:ABC-2 type transport system ATP-binding protein [Anaerobranca gottschalkii DSM 13577]|uniref:ABC-2 type transport system ATP-binding protein n=1 Tax=Anaerobranca gottschalkii DSM 13577 TaxID=1120990 RepID=A0A1H9ZW98_9FIRM|nr:ABC-2 type transport system ATP-binding protein [Anaerobranca gottschalkii DSM 13577]